MIKGSTIIDPSQIVKLLKPEVMGPNLRSSDSGVSGYGRAAGSTVCIRALVVFCFRVDRDGVWSPVVESLHSARVGVRTWSFRVSRETERQK